MKSRDETHNNCHYEEMYPCLARRSRSGLPRWLQLDSANDHIDDIGTNRSSRSHDPDDNDHAEELSFFGHFCARTASDFARNEWNRSGTSAFI
jgi:hypothetical protein